MRFQQSLSTAETETRRPTRQMPHQYTPERSRPSGSELDDAPSEADALPLDVVFMLLKNERRRRVVRYLVTGTGQCRLGELAEHVAARENDKSVREISCYERKRAYVALYQQHLPKLDEADVVDFDSDRGTVRVGDTAPQLTKYLEDTERGSRALASPARELADLCSALGTACRRLVRRR